MHKLRRWLIGFACTIALSKNGSIFVNGPTPTPPKHAVCAHEWLEDNWGWYADCALKGLTEVPQNLNETIVGMNLTGNPIKRLTTNSFGRYKFLSFLQIENLTRLPGQGAREADVSTFLPLKALGVVLMDGAGFSTDFQWPPNIFLLFVDGNKFENLNITHLSMITNISVSRCNLHDVPDVHELATVVLLSALGNPLERLTAERLSQYCKLEKLNISLNVTSPTTESEYCRCTRVKEWVARRKIPGDISFNCGTISDTSTCSLEFAEAEASFMKCLINHGFVEPPIDWSFWFTLGIAVTFICLVVWGVYFRFFRKRNPKTGAPKRVREEDIKNDADAEDEAEIEVADEDEENEKS